MNMLADVQHNQNETAVLLANDDPLVSILLYNYDGRELDSCLHSIFVQHNIRNFEVIICDDSSNDGAWQIANYYVRDYPGKITISRNNIIRTNKA